MNEYTKFLILNYFHEKKHNYTLKDLSDLLGFTLEELSNIIQAMVSENLLEYISNLLNVTTEGVLFLDRFPINADSYISEKFMIKTFDQDAQKLYIPRNFSDNKWS